MFDPLAVLAQPGIFVAGTETQPQDNCCGGKKYYERDDKYLFHTALGEEPARPLRCGSGGPALAGLSKDLRPADPSRAAAKQVCGTQAEGVLGAHGPAASLTSSWEAGFPP